MGFHPLSYGPRTEHRAVMSCQMTASNEALSIYRVTILGINK